MAARKTASRVRSLEGKGDRELAKRLKAAKIEPVQPTGDDLQTGNLPQDVLDELKPGAVVQKGDYVVQIVSIEKGYMNRDVARYRKGFLDQESGKIKWMPETIGLVNHIEKWLLKGA
jgi:hypothetical protein